MSTGFVLLGLVLIALTLAEAGLRRLPLTPAVIYLFVGWGAGAVLGAPSARTLEAYAPAVTLGTELVVLISLFAVGLRLKVPPTPGAWRSALMLAGPGMAVGIALGAVAAWLLLGLPWGAALLLAAVMGPTDPVLASEVQIRSDDDRDAVRLSITAEGGLNDGTALPAVMLGLGLMGLHPLGEGGARWWWSDLLMPIGGGLALGVAVGLLLGRALRARLLRGDPVVRDELLYAGAVTLALGLAHATGTSSFVVMFAIGTTVLWPLHGAAREQAGDPSDCREQRQELGERLHAFGARCERLVEATTVLAVGVALHSVQMSWGALGFALVLVLVVRPLSVLAVIRRGEMSRSQRRLVAWFGIRGIGTLFYLAFALERGVTGALADQLMAAALLGIAASILLHGVSATPLMARYHRRRARLERSAPP